MKTVSTTTAPAARALAALAVSLAASACDSRNASAPSAPARERPSGAPDAGAAVASAPDASARPVAPAGDAPPSGTYTNPVIALERVRRAPVALSEAPDPFVLRHNGEYYLYVSGDPIVVFHSLDLVHWDFAGRALAHSDAPGAWNGQDIWAPEVVYRDGRFYLYYTGAQRSDDWRVQERTRRVGVAVADNPVGPFVDSGHPVTPYWAIDGHVYTDPDSGEQYLFTSYLYEPRLPGAGIVVDRLTAFDTVANRPAHVTRGSEAWEDRDGDPGNGTLRYTNEGPTALRHHGRVYLMYSGGSWDLPTYGVGYASSEALVPPGGLSGPGWDKVRWPVLRSTSAVEGPGHNAVVLAPNAVDTMVVYHARVPPFDGPSSRVPFADRLYWNHDRLFLSPPSRAPLPLPPLPLFGDRFDRADAAQLGAGWSVAEGPAAAWRVAGGEARFAATADAADAGGARVVGAARVAAEPLAYYVFEASARLENAAAGGRAGVTAFAARDGREVVRAWLDAGRRAVVLEHTARGAAQPAQVRALPGEFRFDAFHALRVVRNAARVTVALDGVNRFAVALDAAAEPGAVGLVADAAARFDGVALTSHFDDVFDARADDAPPSAAALAGVATPSALGWAAQGGAWALRDGALAQTSAAADRAVALKGEPAARYEFVASVRVGTGPEGARAGVVAAATDAGELVLAGFDRTIWPFARFVVRRVPAGAAAGGGDAGVTEVARAEVPRGFDYALFHTVRVRRDGESFAFDLDGAPIATARVALAAPARPGLFTEGTAAEFDDCAMTRGQDAAGRR